jgi:hypothetical protein
MKSKKVMKKMRSEAEKILENLIKSRKKVKKLSSLEEELTKKWIEDQRRIGCEFQKKLDKLQEKALKVLGYRSSTQWIDGGVRKIFRETDEKIKDLKAKLALREIEGE